MVFKLSSRRLVRKLKIKKNNNQPKFRHCNKTFELSNTGEAALERHVRWKKHENVNVNLKSSNRKDLVKTKP